MIRRKQLVILFLVIFYPLACAICQDTTKPKGLQQFFYPNGSLSSEGTMQNGQPNDYWKSYYENGILKSEGNRKNFELDSIWKFFNPDGKQILEITYKNGKRNGVKTSWLDRETIYENYINDIKNGYTEYYNIQGWKKMDIPFVKGLEQGIGKEYSRDGKIITITEYKKGFIVDRTKINRLDKYNRKQGKWISFWDNGKYKLEGVFKNDKKNGYFKKYSKKGDLISIEKYIDDILQPEAAEIQKLEVEKEYYTDGKVKSTTLYRNGIREGIRIEFSPEGQIIQAIEYRNGILAGEGLVLEDGSRNG
ncbi:MAG: toxin-antitoxin system YwqK family antitoxin, partial [Bacteroidetes bacterium]|nr:toxin-antitoxin system YwqK family antitoxin [Bacteroidota bacterium]